jgi:hypothetical protein
MNAPKELTPSEKMRSALPDEPKLRRTHPLVFFLTGLLTTVLLGTCCFCGIAAWWLRPQIHEDPERASELTRQIVAITIPDTFQPRGTIEWNLGFVVHLRGVYYERLFGDGVLTLLEVDSLLANDDKIRQHIRDTLLEEGTTGTHLVIDKKLTRKEVFDIGGKPVTFTIDTARDNRTTEVYQLLEGVFPGKSGLVLLSLRVDSRYWQDEAVPLELAAATPASATLPLWLSGMIRSIGQSEATPAPAEKPLPANEIPANTP